MDEMIEPMENAVITAADVMISEVLWVRDEMTVRELADFLAENEITGAPVLDGGDRLVGVVSVTDIAEKSRTQGEEVVDRSNPQYYVRAFDEGLDMEDMKSLHIENDTQLVRDIMTPAIYTVPADMPIAAVAREMVSGRIHRVFVTNLEGAVVGIVTALDVLQLIADEA
jgi:predicted transcriptional regulator